MIDKYLDLARELKKLWNMMVIPIVTAVVGKVLIGLEGFEIRGRIKTIQTTALITLSRILKSLETWWTCHSNSSERPPTKAGVKNS